MNKRMLKINAETHERLKQMKRELSAIEKRDISMSEIVDRTFKAPDVPERLKRGSVERRR